MGARLGKYDSKLAIEDGTIAIATGYGTFEFGLVLASLAGESNNAMQGLLQKVLRLAAPQEVRGAAIEHFVDDFLDFARPSLTYQRMKANAAEPGLEWSGSQVTNGYWRRSSAPPAAARTGYAGPARLAHSCLRPVRGRRDQQPVSTCLATTLEPHRGVGHVTPSGQQAQRLVPHARDDVPGRSRGGHRRSLAGPVVSTVEVAIRGALAPAADQLALLRIRRRA